MAHSEIFILFPICKEDSKHPHYIHCMEIQPVCFFKEIIECIERISYSFYGEHYDGYYDGENVQSFMKLLDLYNNEYPNTGTRFRNVMMKWGENWRNDKKQLPSEKFYYYSTEIRDDTFCEITKRKKEMSETCTFLLINQNAFSCASRKIQTRIDDETFEIDVECAEIKAIATWFENNRVPKREFRLSPKHGELGRGAHPLSKGQKVSVLMCSKEEASILLNSAIGKTQKSLYFYDKKYKQYIEFKQECMNVYHGYHLEKDEESRIPDEIKSLIGILSD